VTSSIVLLTEQALSAGDAARLVALHGPEGSDYRVLVPQDPHANLLADVLDHLSLLELREALDAVRARRHPERDEYPAGETLDASLQRLREAGAGADGRVVDGDPVVAVADELAERPADEVVVVTRPHAVEDTFHTDWASRAREHLGVPVLHVYAGSNWVG